MRNQFEPLPSVEEKLSAFREKLEAFGRLLSKRRSIIGKSARQVSLELGFGANSATVSTWENGTTFPEEERLPEIAKVYGTELEELRRVFEISKEARELEKESRHPQKTIPIKNLDTEVFIPPTDTYLARKTPSNRRRH
jgi:hypothetical protein